MGNSHWSASELAILDRLLESPARIGKRMLEHFPSRSQNSLYRAVLRRKRALGIPSAPTGRPHKDAH